MREGNFSASFDMGLLECDATELQELYDIGGRSFMAFNLAPIGCYPAFLEELPHDTWDLDIFGCMVSYNKAVVDYNNMLNESLTQMREMLPNASIVYVDTHSIKLELFQHPKDYGELITFIS